MPSETPFPVALLHRKLGSGAILTEALFAPGICRLGNATETAASALRELLRDHLAEAEPGELIRHRRGSNSGPKIHSDRRSTRLASA